jgi:hypothetical protein
MAKRIGESTFDREMKDPIFRAAYIRESAMLEVSEFLATQMTEQAITVRALAALASVSPTVVQGIKSGRRKNIEYTTLKALTVALGYNIMFTKMYAAKSQTH